jgi:uncharacterized protein YndB with AHSA1/START domain
MARGLVAKQSVEVDAPTSKVWDALVNPAMIKQYMFGTTAGSPAVRSRFQVNGRASRTRTRA